MEDSSGSQPLGNVRASWLSISLSRPVVWRACGFMVVVGGVLIAINHGDAIAVEVKAEAAVPARLDYVQLNLITSTDSWNGRPSIP